MGIKLKTQWIATLDGRTRHSHRQLDGETIPVGGTFSNGCKYPGDPDGAPSEIYNCRCTTVAQLEGFEINHLDPNLRPSEILKEMSYEEWQAGHGVSERITNAEETAELMRRRAVSKYRR